MRTVQGSALRSLRAVQEFLDANATVLAVVATSAPRKRLDDLVVALQGYADAQSDNIVAAHGATLKLQTLRETLLLDHMAPIAKIAAAELPGTPELDALRMPQGEPSPERLKSLAAAMAAAAAAHTDVFTGAGFPADFVAQLNSAADAMLNAVNAREQNRIARTGATKGIKTLLSSGRKIVHALDAMVRRTIRSNQPLYAAWQEAKRVKLVPGGGQPAPAQAPAPAPAPAAT